jgi:hypothetical protein
VGLWATRRAVHEPTERAVPWGYRRHARAQLPWNCSSRKALLCGAISIPSVDNPGLVIRTKRLVAVLDDPEEIATVVGMERLRPHRRVQGDRSGRASVAAGSSGRRHARAVNRCVPGDSRRRSPPRRPCRRARSRCAAARRLYRSSLRSSGSRRRTALADRSGSCDGIVAEPSMGREGCIGYRH